MTLVTLIVFCVVILVIFSFIPVDARVKQVVYVVLVIAIVLWLLHALGLFGGSPSLRLSHSSDTQAVYVAEALDAETHSMLSGSVISPAVLPIAAP